MKEISGINGKDYYTYDLAIELIYELANKKEKEKLDNYADTEDWDSYDSYKDELLDLYFDFQEEKINGDDIYLIKGE